MKNVLKKCSLFCLAMIMAMLSVMPTMAAESEKTEAVETDSGYEVYEEEFILEPGESISETDLNSAVSTLATIDQTFTMTSYHRGADRTYSSSNLRFSITITDTNGNATSDKVSVTLRDYNGYASGWVVTANGSIFSKSGISIVAGRVYYFTYSNSGSSTLRVNMVIISY